MYYALIACAVILFGGGFALQDVFRKRNGTGIETSIGYTFLSSVAGLVAFCVLNGFKAEFTVFTFIMALLNALNGIAFTFCAFKALGAVNLSVFSVFSMLGGMALPFLQGILFYGERFTVAKGICFLLMSIAILVTAERGGRLKGMLYCAAIFIFNGMSGVLSKIFAAAPFEKTSVAGYTILASLCTVAISGVLLMYFIFKKKKRFNFKITDIGIMAAGGVTGRIANFWLVLALLHIDASVQYPLVTGGTMIVSTLLGFLGEKKPSKKDVLSVIIAFAGTLAIFVIPI